MDKETDINIELRKYAKELDDQKHEIPNQVDRMLAYGSVNLGLNDIDGESASEERIKEDLKK